MGIMYNPLGSLVRLPRGFFCILQLFYSSHGFFACNSGPLKVHFFHVIQAKHTKPSPESAAAVNGYGILSMKNPVRYRSVDKSCRQLADIGDDLILLSGGKSAEIPQRFFLSDGCDIQLLVTAPVHRSP